MKRSLLIAIAVLLIAALFVGCNADKIEEDQLVEVTIASDLSKGLIAEGASTASVADLYWYYSAEKTAGYFKTGETEWSAVKEGKGLEGSLGQMSTGGWNFCFYGFKEEQATKPSEPEATAIFYQKDLRKAITGPVALEISLSRGAGSLGAPIAVFGDNLFWKYNSDIGTVTLTITNNGEPVHVYEGTPANGTVTFSTDEDEFVLSAGGNLLAFKVVSSYTIEGVAFEEQLGYSELNIVAESGMKYTITCDTNGIDFYPYGEAIPVVSIGDINVPVTATATVVASTTTQGYVSKVETSNTPAASTTAKTTVEFPVDLAGKNVTVETSSAEVASSKSFVVSAGSGAVASIELSISDGTKTFGEGNKAQVTTFIGTGLVGVEVHYSGNDAADIDQTDVSYDPATGYVTFLTPHFSEFYVTAEGEAQIGTKVYKTLVEAIAAAQDGSIITLLKSISLDSTIVIDGKVLTIDLNGNNITSSKDPAIKLNSGDLTLTGTGVVKTTANSGDAIGVYGSETSVEKYAVLSIDPDVTLIGGYAGIDIAYGRAHAYGVVVNVKGKIEADEAAIYINGNILDTTGFVPEIILDGATITTETSESVGIYAAGYAKWIIKDATITGVDSAIEIRAGELSIESGTFKSTSNTYSITPNGNGTTTTGAAIAVAQHSTHLPLIVDINGGTFTGKIGLSYSFPEVHTVEDIEKTSVTIDGGVFSGRFCVYVLDGGTLTVNGGTFNSTDCAFNVSKDSELVISDATVTAQEVCVLVTDAGKATINGGSFTSIDNFVVGTNGSTGRGGNIITINGGTFNGGITSTGYIACGIYLANADTLAVNAGTFEITNGCGVLVRSGSAAVGNATIAEDVIINVSGTTEGKVGDSAVLVPCKELVLDLRAGYPGGTPSITNDTSYEVTVLE